MPLETATNSRDLNANWPVGATDPKSQGDDHIRMLKVVIQSLFPVGSVLTYVDETDPNSLFPGTWVKAEGVFIRGTPSGGTVGDTGGSDEVILTEAQLPAHTHGPGTLRTDDPGTHNHDVFYADEANGGGSQNTVSGSGNSDGNVNSGQSGAHTHAVVSGVTGATGSGEAVPLLPSYKNYNIWERTA